MPQEFPDDENGDVLRRMRDSGDDLSRPRIVDFTTVFPDQERARQLAEMYESRGCVVAVKYSGVVPELPWDVTVSNFMVPTYQAITDFENGLGASAEPLGGRSDGWGCFEGPNVVH